LKYRSFIVLMLIYCISTQKAQSQILNVESLRMVTDTVGWSGQMGLAISASKYTKSFFTFNSNGHIQLKQEKNLYLVVANIDMVNVDGASFNKTGFAHFRYNRKLSEWVKLEAFTQIQSNVLTKIGSRWLNGVGIRLKLSQYEKAKFYYGLTYMHESEKITDRTVTDQANRVSSYFTFTLAPESIVTFSNTTYVQPLIGNIHDFRVSNDINLAFKINKHLSLITSLHYLYDSKPPTDVPATNYQIFNGLTFKF
jgi:Protein of unknown function, DUF481